MSKQQRKRFKQETALATENSFEQFCQKNNIEYSKLDLQKNKSARNKYLINPMGKCLDFWCKKEGKEIFIEVKTLTNLTDQKREVIIEAAIDDIKSKKLPGGITSEAFDPIPELEGPFTTFLKDASSKFKNIRSNFQHPKILFLDGVAMPKRIILNAIFYGAFDSYKRKGSKLVTAGLQKTKRGLFDKTGSNVSALIYWNKDKNCFYGLENYKAKISFSENYFETFFGKTKIYQHIT